MYIQHDTIYIVWFSKNWFKSGSRSVTVDLITNYFGVHNGQKQDLPDSKMIDMHGSKIVLEEYTRALTIYVSKHKDMFCPTLNHYVIDRVLELFHDFFLGGGQ